MNLPLNQMLLGDALAVLRTLPDACVDCCVTSPPYMALRSYLPADDPLKAQEMGSEPTIAEFIERLVGVFREVRRVLKPTGVLFVNIADSYAGSGKGSGGTNPEKSSKQNTNVGAGYAHGQPIQPASDQPPAKSLMLVPERFLIAMQEDGWIVRDRCAWIKGREYADDDVGLNPMPGSQKDRCTNAYEFVYMFVKQAKYYFDWQAIAEPPRQSSMARLGQDVDAQAGSTRANGGAKTNGPMKAVLGNTFARDSKYGAGQPAHKSAQHRPDREPVDYTAVPLVMPRNVWIFPSRGYKGAHYATFPPELPRRCILLGCPPAGKRCDCDEIIETPTGERCASDPSTITGRAGMNRPRGENEGSRPMTRREQRHHAQEMRTSPHRAEIESECGEAFAHYIRTDLAGARPLPQALRQKYATLGWITTPPPCSCPVEPAGVVLDCFMGSGTTAQVAEELGRAWIGIDLDARNLTLIEQRLAEVRAKLKSAVPETPLFTE